jgi:putative ABC transport system permease protein
VLDSGETSNEGGPGGGFAGGIGKDCQATKNDRLTHLKFSVTGACVGGTQYMLDFRLAVRNLFKNPGFTIVALLTLALGVGANTAIFSVVKAVLINPLPYRDADRLVAIAESSSGSPRPITVDFTTTHDWRDRSRLFESMSLYRFTSAAFVEGETPELLNTMRVNYDFFDTLGVKMALGRAFLPEEDRSSGRFRIILTNALWTQRFGADPKVLGRVVRLNESSFTVVGVLPKDFPTLLGGDNIQAFTPLGYDLGGDSSCRGCQHLRLIAKLKAGVTPAQAGAELTSILQKLKTEYPTSYSPDTGVTVKPLREQLLGRVTNALWVLLAAVGLVLLIACVNVANLLLARASSRAKEIALRAALGAGRGRIVRQLLIESGVLALVGGAAGVGLAWIGISAFLQFAPKEIPRLSEIRMDAAVLLFSLAASLLTGILFGLVPALRASRVDLIDAMKGLGKSTESGRGSRTRSGLAMAELALAFVLVVGAGLLLKSFARLINVNPGYDTHNVLTLNTYVYGSRYQGTKSLTEIALYDQVMATLAATPGVESSAMVSTLPLNGFDRRSLHIQDRPAVNEADAPSADTYSITPAYFQTMRIPLKRGRMFTAWDRSDAPPVAIISLSAAKSLWPGEDALGKQIQFGRRDDKKPWATVVGIVGDIRQYGLDRAPNMEAYIPLAQNTSFSYQMVIRTTVDPRQIERAARDAFAKADKTQPIFNVQPLDDYVKSTLAERTLTMSLLVMFGALALGLAAIGIYGVISYAVTLRTREVGIRMALGAKKGDVLGMILWQSLGMAAGGLIVGFAASLALTRFLSTLLYEVRPTDLATSAMVTGLLVAVAMAASYIPARRAMKVDPAIALRDE